MSFIRFMNWSDFFLGSKVNNLAEDRKAFAKTIQLPTSTGSKLTLHCEKYFFLDFLSSAMYLSFFRSQIFYNRTLLFGFSSSSTVPNL